MKVEIETGEPVQVQADWLVVAVAPEHEPGGRVASLNASLGGLVTTLREAGDLKAEANEVLVIRRTDGIAATRLLLVGVGTLVDLSVSRVERALATAARTISEHATDRVAIVVPEAGIGEIAPDSFCRIAIQAMINGCAGQDLYRTERKRFPIRSVALICEADLEAQARDEAGIGSIIGEAVVLTRELVDRPPQEIFPESLAERARQLADEYGMECDVFDEQQLHAERMQAMLAVARGSVRPPRMVVLRYTGAGDDAPVLGLVGKGVTFDSGGLSLKTNDSMKTMKCDMAGAATVLGAMSAIARLELPVNVIGLTGLVENMPGGSSYKLGDILTARNGTTIEVLNTDAEGRLVLADVLSYANDLRIDRLIDVATLTGACVVALGEEVAGAFTNHQDWCDVVLSAAGESGEDVWQLPTLALYDELIQSDIADIKNVGSRWGGAISAAKFLERFVGETPWVHLDIAGPSFAATSRPWREAGATGCIVRTLIRTATRFPAAMR